MKWKINYRKHFWFSLMTLVLGLGICRGQFQRCRYDFSMDWLMERGDPENASSVDFPDHSWQQVSLPHAFNEDSAFAVSIEKLPTGICWYRKHFILPRSSGAQKVFFISDGLRQAGLVYVNGHYVGSAENGVMAFGLDITNFVYSDKPNVIAIRVDNSWDYRGIKDHATLQWNDRNFYANYGGLNKKVFLEITGKIYQTLPLFSFLKTEGVYVYAKKINLKKRSADICVRSEVKNEEDSIVKLEFKIFLLDRQTDRKIAEFRGEELSLQPHSKAFISAQSVVKGLHFWSWGYGYLYRVISVLIRNGKIIDRVETITGFRKTAFKNGTVYLNGVPLHLKGYAQRSTNEWPAVGTDVPAYLSDYSNGLMVRGNACLVRWMHVTPSRQDVLSCDRCGLPEAMPAGDAEADPDSIHFSSRLALMRDAMILNRNSPSIFFYECGNKEISQKHMAMMRRLYDILDPYGGRAIGCREMLSDTLAQYGGEMLYVNKSAGRPLWSMEYCRDEGLREYWDEQTPPYHKDGDGPFYRGAPAPEYNHNQDSYLQESVRRWYEYWKERPGTGRRVNAGGVNIIFSGSNTHHRGAVSFRASGEVDPMRIAKDAYFAHQVMWNGWVDPEPKGIFLSGHWNYALGVKKTIQVVSAADSVVLFLNGQRLSRPLRSYHFLFTFKDVAWQPGVLTAVAFDRYGHKLSESSLYSTGKPVAVRLKRIEPLHQWIANGVDLVLIEAELIDGQGRRVPDAFAKIHFSVTGPVVWRGGLDIFQSHNGILSHDLSACGGVTRILLRSERTSGVIHLKANSDGLLPDSLSLENFPLLCPGGLYGDQETQQLSSLLLRGPAPSHFILKPKRRFFPIAFARVGSGAASASLSYDDNETTSWQSEGPLSGAWIEYDLEHPGRLNAISLKMKNFRTCCYPVSVYVDGKKVYGGVTPLSLGYIELHWTPIWGRKVKIVLSAPNRKIVKGDLSELNGLKSDEVSYQGTHHDELAIIEAEIYGPVSSH